jgi:hypothetical protein
VNLSSGSADDPGGKNGGPGKRAGGDGRGTKAPVVPGVTVRAKLRDAGSGDVWSGRVDATGADCTIRVFGLPSGGGAVDRALEVARRLVDLRHPHLVTVTDVIPTTDGVALLTEPVVGAISLGRLLGVRERIEPGEVVTIGLPTAQALAAAHAAGVAHGRLGRDDILLEPNGRPILAGVGLTSIVGFPGSPATDVRDLADLLLDAMLHATGPDAAAVAVAVATALVDDPARRPSAAELAASLARSCAPIPVRLVSEPIQPLSMPPPPPGVDLAAPRSRPAPTPPAPEPPPKGMRRPGPATVGAGRGGAQQSPGQTGQNTPTRPPSAAAAPGTGAAPADAVGPAGTGKPAGRGREGADTSLTVLLGGGDPGGAGSTPATPGSTRRGAGRPPRRPAQGSAGAPDIVEDGGESERARRPSGAGARKGRPAANRGRAQFVLFGLACFAVVALALALLFAGGSSGRQSAQDHPGSTGGDGTAQPATVGEQPPGEQQWRDTLAELDAARAEAFGKADESLLIRVDAAGSSALAGDTATLRKIAGRGAHATGPRYEVESIEVQNEGTDKVVLRVTDRLLPYSFLDANGKVLATQSGKPAQTRDVTLVRTTEGWRIAQVTPVTG